MIYIVGSLANDILLECTDTFHSVSQVEGTALNLSVLARGMTQTLGGTASNIAFNLRLLQIPVGIVGVLGKDSAVHLRWLQSKGIDTSAIACLNDAPTATAIVATDSVGAQISLFYPGALSRIVESALTSFEWRNASLVVISAGVPEAQRFAVNACKVQRVPFVYNPGQSLAGLSRQELISAIDGATVLLVNEFELKQIVDTTGMDERRLANCVNVLAVTRGEKGSVLTAEGQSTLVEALPISGVVDPTGAGDAYCAGLIRGLITRQPIGVWGRIASVAASYCIECNGTLLHGYSWEEFKTRYTLAYGIKATSDELPDDFV
jgi:adenosine kinase